MAKTEAEPHTQFTIRVPTAYVAALQEKAAKEERTVSGEIRLLIRSHIEKQAA